MSAPSVHATTLEIFKNVRYVFLPLITISPNGMHQMYTSTLITAALLAPFRDLGMRLSGHTEWGTDRQWDAQALFEFGYAEYMGKSGTAYDLSVMKGSDADVGIGAYPLRDGKGSGNCKSKSCFPWSCPMDQGWTDESQWQQGSPADTVCYFGKTDF